MVPSTVSVHVLALALSALASYECLAAPKKAQTSVGAIAYHRDSRSFGFSVDAANARTAKTEALAQCAHPKCEVVARLRNDCGAIADGPKRFTVGRGATKQEAETKALRMCGDGCKIAGWACTR